MNGLKEFWMAVAIIVLGYLVVVGLNVTCHQISNWYISPAEVSVQVNTRIDELEKRVLLLEYPISQVDSLTDTGLHVYSYDLDQFENRR